MPRPSSSRTTVTTSYGTECDTLRLGIHNPANDFSPLNGVSPQPPHVQTRSNHLGMLDPEDPEIFHNHSYGSSNFGRYFQPYYEAAQANRPQRHQIDDYIREGSWRLDAQGRPTYIGRGRIEEVIDGETDIMPNGTANGFSSRQSSHASFNDEERPSFMNGLTSPLPPDTTPPPPPQRGFMDLLPSPTGDTNKHYLIDNVISNSAHFPASMSMQNDNDDRSDFDILNECVALCKTTVEALHEMHKKFSLLDSSCKVDQHLDMCGHLENALNGVHKSLTRRMHIDDNDWALGSPRWREKYHIRLQSVLKSVQRLRGMERFINFRKPREHQLEIVLRKLQEHEAKLLNLSSKFNTSFDRLKIRRLHAMLAEAHAEAREKQELRLASRESFQRRWQEGKADRANLRCEYLYHVEGIYNTSF